MLSSPVECDCKWYWFIKTIKEKSNHISLPGLSCRQHWGNHTLDTLAEIDPEDIACTVEENCPIGCKCFELAGSKSILVNCTDGDLDKVPIIDNIKELVISNNHVTDLQSDVLPDSLQVSFVGKI